jgi:hypothetical protein
MLNNARRTRRDERPANQPVDFEPLDVVDLVDLVVVVVIMTGSPQNFRDTPTAPHTGQEHPPPATLHKLPDKFSDADRVTIEQDGKALAIAHANIAKARLAPDYAALGLKPARSEDAVPAKPARRPAKRKV